MLYGSTVDEQLQSSLVRKEAKIPIIDVGVWNMNAFQVLIMIGMYNPNCNAKPREILIIGVDIVC